MRYASCLLAALILFQATPAAAQTRRAAAAHLKRGDLLMSRNRVDAAWAAAYVKRGMARRAKGDLDGSIEDYEKAGGWTRARRLTTRPSPSRTTTAG
jgi:hypothetical protein